MALTTTGVRQLAQLAAGQGTPFNSANTYLGVGNGTTAFSVDQNDLTGSGKIRKPVDAGYPVINGVTLKYRATFAPNEANFAWNEWGLFNSANTSGVMLNRVVESNGTKQSNQTWVLEVDITFAVG